MASADVSLGELGLLRGPFVLVAEEPWFRSLLEEAARRPMGRVPQITTVRLVELSDHPTTKTVGLTTYSEKTTAAGLERTQTITFYSELLRALSPRAALGVIAHELAHAWLNEHVGPEESKKRELDADRAARSWGFAGELDALDAEADTVD